MKKEEMSEITFKLKLITRMKIHNIIINANQCILNVYTQYLTHSVMLCKVYFFD